MVSWRDIETAALNDPVLHAAVTYHRMGMTQFEVLCHAALAYSRNRQEQQAKEADRLQNLPAASVLVNQTTGEVFDLNPMMNSFHATIALLQQAEVGHKFRLELYDKTNIHLQVVGITHEA